MNLNKSYGGWTWWVMYPPISSIHGRALRKIRSRTVVDLPCPVSHCGPFLVPWINLYPNHHQPTRNAPGTRQEPRPPRSLFDVRTPPLPPGRQLLLPALVMEPWLAEAASALWSWQLILGDRSWLTTIRNDDCELSLIHGAVERGMTIKCPSQYLYRKPRFRELCRETWGKLKTYFPGPCIMCEPSHLTPPPNMLFVYGQCGGGNSSWSWLTAACGRS